MPQHMCGYPSLPPRPSSDGITCDHARSRSLYSTLHDIYILHVYTQSIALFYTLNLLRAVDALHRADLLHADLKPDNVIVRCADPSLVDPSEPMSGPSWSGQGLRLLDFGRSIDRRQYPQGTVFASSEEVRHARTARARVAHAPHMCDT